MMKAEKRLENLEVANINSGTTVFVSARGNIQYHQKGLVVTQLIGHLRIIQSIFLYH